MKVEQIQEILRTDYLSTEPKPARENKGIIKLVDLMVTQNAEKHNTSMFALVTKLKIPIFRRGQQFSLRIEFKEKFELTKENLRLDFSFGSDPLPGDGTLNQLKVPVTVSKTLPESKGWGVCVTSKEVKSLNLEVKPSPVCPVGIWFMTIVTEPNKQAFNVPQHMYILFNPWCKADLVYMENDNWRKEYVLNDNGILYKTDQYAQPWNIKQFQSVTLTAALYLLEFKAGDECYVKNGERGLPEKVCRAICWLDASYILEGKWAKTYEGGKRPSYWTGSLQILEHFMKTKTRAKFGQCWCFAGIRLSLFRALGIPCRATSIYNAGAGGDDIFIDTIWDFSKKEVKQPESISTEFIWNFHVWNNVWMLRTDLPAGYGGWQVADGGPLRLASLVAVKKGEVGLNFNTKSVFCEVNGDEIISHILADGTTVVKEINESRVGTLILTKAAGEYKSDDITLEHKFLEGSKEERAAVLNAAKLNHQVARMTKPTPTSHIHDDVFFHPLKIETKMIGQPITISVEIENRGNDKRWISFTLGAHSVEYTGKICQRLNVSKEPPGAPLYEKTYEVVPTARETVEVIIQPEMYVEKLCNFAYVRILAWARTYETKQVWTKMETVALKTPKLTLNMPDDLVLLRKSIITVTFTNPLPKELTGCSLHIEGSCQSLTENDTQELNNVKPNETVAIRVDFSPEALGPCVVSAIFNSNLLTNVAASKTVNVAEKPKN